jgi:nitroimidazol reductase NimA-like FMN-containing flavoprotein (pyridoxamine 5'-phosphate oxidase superfamily)
MQHTERTTVRRHVERAAYDAETIYGILDAGIMCHVAFEHDGWPFAIPSNYGRSNDTIYVHGSPESRMMRALAAGAPACITVTHLDGLVLARSTFSHSANFRSAVILGHGRPVVDETEKLEALRCIVEQVVPGRAADARGPSAKELTATMVVAVQIEEASAKIRCGGPKDPAEDRGLDVWAGVLPLGLVPGRPIPEPDLAPHLGVPDYVTHFRRSSD